MADHKYLYEKKMTVARAIILKKHGQVFEYSLQLIKNPGRKFGSSYQLAK